MLRLYVHRLYFFVNDDMNWNMFDFILVMLSVLDQALSFLLQHGRGEKGGGGGNVGFMRFLRLLKLTKIFRTFRTMRFFKDLSVLLDSFRRSLLSVIWSCVLLSLMLFIFALIFVQALADYITLEGADDFEFKSEAFRTFGSLGTSMLTLYMAVTGGNDWELYYEVVARAGTLYAALFLLFTYYFLFALFNILTGILVEKAVAAAAPDRNDLVLQNHRKAREDADELWHMCEVLDKTNRGTITRYEFETMLQNRVFVSYMASLGLEVHDMQIFFSTIAGTLEEGVVTIEQFVDACVNMRGNATSVDMHRQLLESSMLRAQLQRFEQKNTKAVERMEEQTRAMMELITRSRLGQRARPCATIQNSLSL
jgi:hypothetical protein